MAWLLSVAWLLREGIETRNWRVPTGRGRRGVAGGSQSPLSESRRRRQVVEDPAFRDAVVAEKLGDVFPAIAPHFEFGEAGKLNLSGGFTHVEENRFNPDEVKFALSSNTNRNNAGLCSIWDTVRPAAAARLTTVPSPPVSWRVASTS